MHADRTRTYAIGRIPDVQIRTVCEEVGCDAWRYGWETVINEATALGVRQAHYIRHGSGRAFHEMRSGELTIFRFESGQRCFEDHRTTPETYVRGIGTAGRWIGDPFRHRNGRDWTEDYNEHVGRIKDEIQRG